LNTSTNSNLIHTYTNEQVQFSKQLIEQWSNFIKYGRPTSLRFSNEWIPITNISTASIMHLQVNRSGIEKLNIPSGVKFWMTECECLTKDNIRKSNEASIYKISLTIFIWSLLFNKMLKV
jgi:hypothetical protein